MSYKDTEVKKLKKSIQYLEDRAADMRRKGMLNAAVIYEDRASFLKTRLKNWYSVKY